MSTDAYPEVRCRCLECRAEVSEAIAVRGPQLLAALRELVYIDDKAAIDYKEYNRRWIDAKALVDELESIVGNENGRL